MMTRTTHAISTAVLAAAALLASACASQGPANSQHAGRVTEPSEHAEQAADRSATDRAVRRGAAVVQGGVLLARSFPLDPLKRPVSNLLSLGSYTLKSAAGFTQRMVIGTAAFPALETRPIPDVGRGEPMDLAEWEHGLDRLTGRPTSYGTIKLLIDGEEYFDRMLAAIDAADESIDVRTYIFDNDDFGVRVADYLRRKSRQVDVRVMFDGLGNLMALQTDPDSMPAKFVAPISMERYLEYDSKVRVRTLNNPWLTGDHTKTTIIDREVAFIGGMNIGREYRYDWHDVMMEVRGPVVDQLAYDADKAWARASVFGDVAYLLTAIKGKRKTADRHGYPVRTLYTREFDSEIFRAQLEAIRRARQYIYIENSYFSDDATLYELARARRRGVDVRIILPADGNHGSHDASNAVAINRMLRNGIRVYRFPGMSHVKAAVIDGWASLGTANFDKLSLQVNKEVNLATSHAPFVELLLQRVFYADMERSDEVTEAVDITLQARLMEMLADEVL
jgi:cardiolipin synthase